MNEKLEELACLYVLDQLDPSERAVFEARLVREPELETFVREMQTTVAMGVHALPQNAPPATSLARIEARISEPASVALPLKEERRRASVMWVSFARWGLAAAVALSLTILAVQSLRRPPAAMIVFVRLDSNRNTFAELPLGKRASDPDDRFVQLASLAEGYWENPADLPVNTNQGASEGRGYALIDPSSRQGFIAVEQLPAIAEHQRYHLWVVDPASGLIRDAGVLPLSGRNSGLYSFTVGSATDEQSMRPKIFITVEDAGIAAAHAQPRGKVVLGERRT
jgi:anti-sigma-K factor RskA